MASPAIFWLRWLRPGTPPPFRPVPLPAVVSAEATITVIPARSFTYYLFGF